MTPRTDWAELAVRLAATVETAMDEIRPRLLRAAFTGDYSENTNHRHAGNFLSTHDLWMHDRYCELLSAYLPSYIYASEEADPLVVGADSDPDLLVLVDPLDTSELAVRGLNGYTHAMIYSRALGRPVATVVGDIYHHVRLYAAHLGDDNQDHAYVINADGSRHELRLREPAPLSEALVTNFLMKPTERFRPLAARDSFLDALARPGPDGKARGRIGVDFGSVSLCHVAAGFTDATIEFAKGFALWDLAPGQHILHAAGGTVLGLDGRALHFDLDTPGRIATEMGTRHKFVAAAPRLATEILGHFG